MMRSSGAESAPATAGEIQSRVGACEGDNFGLHGWQSHLWTSEAEGRKRVHLLARVIRMSRASGVWRYGTEGDLQGRLRFVCDYWGWEYPKEAGQ